MQACCVAQSRHRRSWEHSSSLPGSLPPHCPSCRGKSGGLFLPMKSEAAASHKTMSPRHEESVLP